MALTAAEKKTHGIELIEWIYFGIRAGARESVNRYYSHLNAGDQATAEYHIKRGIDMPFRARHRINKFIAEYDAIEGAGAGVAVLSECITAAGFRGITVATVNQELIELEAAAQTLVGHVNNDGWTWEQCCDAIVNYFGLRPTGELMPIDPAYVTVFGDSA